jgi:hypothetical protein
MRGAHFPEWNHDGLTQRHSTRICYLLRHVVSQLLDQKADG